MELEGMKPQFLIVFVDNFNRSVQKLGLKRPRNEKIPPKEHFKDTSEKS